MERVPSDDKTDSRHTEVNQVQDLLFLGPS